MAISSFTSLFASSFFRNHCLFINPLKLSCTISRVFYNDEAGGEVVDRTEKRPSSVLITDDEVADYEGWQAMPSDIMGLIVAQLDGTDRVYTSAVCKSWYRILKQNNIPRPRQIPWLLLPHEKNPKALSFIDLSRGKVREIKMPRTLGNRWYCCGSSKGWLAMIADNFDMFLYNPISGERHQLPSLKTIPGLITWGYWLLDSHKRILVNLQKIELSSEDPLNCKVAAIFDQRQVLACCRPKDKAWTVFEGVEGGDEYQRRYMVILFRKDTLYASTFENNEEEDGLKVRARTFNIKVGDDSDSENVTLNLLPVVGTERVEPTMYFFNKFRVIENAGVTHYLIESDKNKGEMLAVIMYSDKLFQDEDDGEQEEDDYSDEDDYNKPNLTYYKTRKYELFKVISDEDDIMGTCFNIQKLESLDEGTLFLSQGGSTYIESSEEGIKNCICFAEDYALPHPKASALACREIGIFNLQNGTIKRCFPSVKLPLKSSMSWFTPNFILKCCVAFM